MPTTTRKRKPKPPTGRPVGRPRGAPHRSISTRVPLELRAAIWQVAETEGIPPQRVMRRWLEEGLARHATGPS